MFTERILNERIRMSSTISMTTSFKLEAPVLQRPEKSTHEFFAQTKDSAWHTWKEMATEIVQARYLLWQFTLRDLRVRYKQTVMGYAWAVLMPFIVIGAGLVVKYLLAQAGGKALDATVFAGMSVKVIAWSFFVGAMNFSVNSLFGNRHLIGKIYFPREVLPLSSILTQMIDTLIGATLVFAILLCINGIAFTVNLLWLVPVLGMLVLLVAGMGLLLSCANLFFRDVKYIVQVGLTFGIFFAPVFVEVEQFGPIGSILVMLNPVAPLLEGIRLAAVEGHCLGSVLYVTNTHGQEILAWHPIYLLYAALWSIGGTLVSWWIFHKAEFKYAEYA